MSTSPSGSTGADVSARRAAFRQMHQAGCFVIPNPWDRGSAVLLEQLGFSALASSSAGYAFSRARPDRATALSCDEVLTHLGDLVDATSLPVNADFQAGYAADPEGVAANVRRCVATGVAGLSIEDATGDRSAPLYELGHAVQRLAAARAAIDEQRSGVMLTGRAECFLVGHSQPLEEAIRRLRAYADAGADVLYAPGLRDATSIRAVIEAVAPKPVNVLVGANFGLKVSEVAALGARRISVGSALARVAFTAFLRAARAISPSGDGGFAAFEGIASTTELSQWFERGR
jgi:2-methylisocitrate lyase-like PEP mutase family enzyme